MSKKERVEEKKDNIKLKIGVICEGSVDSDIAVFKYLIEQINIKINENNKNINLVIEVSENPLGNKKDIFRDCGKAIKNLLEIEKCDKVFILWDLQPSWGEDPVCRHNDKEKIFKSLDDNKVDRNNVILVCVEKMLEAWLLSDESALEEYLSSREKIDQTKKPENEKDPKSKLITIFKKYGRNKIYQETTDAKKLIKKIKSNTLEKKCPSYKRLKEKIENQVIVKKK